MIRMICGSLIVIAGLFGFAMEISDYQSDRSWDSYGLLIAAILVAVGGCLFYFGRLARIGTSVFKKNYFTLLNIVATYQIVGGIVGIRTGLNSLTSLLRDSPASSYISIFICLLFLLFTSLLLVSGYLILRDSLLGLRISKILQLMQIPIISSNLIVFFAGVLFLFQVGIEIANQDYGVFFRINPAFGYYAFILHANSPNFVLAFNPISLIFYLKLSSEIKNRK